MNGPYRLDVTGVSLLDMLTNYDPFWFNPDERRECGYTPNRSLTETRRALDAWYARRAADGMRF